MTHLFRQFTEAAGSAGRSIATEIAVGVLVGALSLTGGGFLIAAGYGRLARSIGPDGAAALIGVVLLALAGLVVLIRAQQRRAARRRLALIAEIEAAAAMSAAAPDPLRNVIFAASFELARMWAARRR
jgi:hypothetical protein